MDRSTGCKLFLSVAVLFLLLLGYTPAHAGSATLTWVASSDPNLAGYRVYVGVASGVYGAPTDVGKVTTWTVPNLTAGVTYYFAVTAYNTAGMESSYSNEVSKLIPLDLTPPLLSTIAASNLTVNSATISWSTDKLSDSQIQYGTTTAYGATTPLIATLVTVHSQVLSNLSAGTLYHYRVLSRDALGNLATSADNTFTTPADTTPPSVPGGVSGGALSSSQVTLSWNASTDNVGVVGYRIYRNGSQAATTAATSFTDGGLSANTTYSYSIAAYDAAGNLSAQSTAVAVTTLPLAPVVSAAAASSITSSAATLTGSVNPSGAATSAWFEYGSTTAYGSSTAPVNVSSATSLSAPLTGLVAGTVYHFRLVARNAGGTSVTIDATFSTAAPPTVAPSASSPTPTPGYTLSADPYVWAAAATPFTLSGDDNTAVLSLPFSFPFYGQSYTQLYVSTNGLITFGSANSAFTPQSIPNPSPPNAFIAPFWRDLYVNAGQITIASSAAQVVIAFNGVRDLCCSTSNSFEVILSPDGMILLEYGSIVINGPTTSGIENQDGSNGVTIASVSSNTAFRLTPNGYQSAPSAPSDTTAPSAPSGLTATAISTSQINLTWVASTDNVGVTGYRVYRNGAQVGTSATLSYSDTGLVPSTIYSYTVAAYDAAGNLSGQSAAVSASTPAPPDTTPPVLSSITSGSITPSGAVITWSTNEPSDTQVEYGTTTAYGASTALVSTLVTAHSQNLSGLTSSTLYHYRVKSRDAAGNLAVSGDATFTTATPPDTAPPSIPSGLTAAVVSSSQVNLSWVASTDNVGVTGYRVYRNGVQVGTSATLSYSDTGLAASTTYSYTVAAYDAAGNLSGQSASVSASTPAPPDTTPPSAPTGLTATAISSGQINLSWAASTDNVGVTGYRVERCQGAGCANFAQIATLTGITFSDTTGLSASTSYSYRVRANDAAGNLSSYSNTANATTVASASPGGLAAAYGFSEGSGITTADASGNGNTGTLSGQTWTTAGKYGNALLFNANGAVDLGNSPTLQITGSMTIEAWINPSAFPADDSGVVSKRGPNGDLGYQLDTTVDTGVRTIGFKLIDPSGNKMSRYGKTTLVTGAWQHIAGVYDAASQTMHVYLNGVLDDGNMVGTVAASQLNSSQHVFIGRRAAGQTGTEFSGTIDEVRIYSRALSQSEIQADMTASSSTGLAAAYGFSEGSGTTTADASGNGNTGTLSGQTWTTAGKYGNALLFNANGAVDLGNSPTLQITGSMTIEAWINPSAFPAGDSGVVSKRGAAGDLGYQLDTTVDTGPRTIGFKLADPSGNNMARYGKSALVTGAWQHIAGVYDAAAQTMHVYLNGVLDDGSSVGTVTPSQRDSSQDVFIGRRAAGSAGSVFSGTIDEVRIYNRALSQAEIQADIAAAITKADTAPPTTPTSLTATAASSSQINLSWVASTDNVGVTGYQIYRNGAPVGTSAIPGYSDTGLSAATSYSYTVAAYDAAGNLSAQSAAVSARTQPLPDTTSPSIPTGLSATAVSVSQINLSWTASTDNVGVTGYRIYRNSAQVGISVSPSFSDTGLAASTIYSYTVAAYDAAGNLSAQSAAVSASTPAPPDTTAPSVPTGLTATAISSSRINLSWVASTDNVGVAGYRVYRNGTQVGTAASATYSDSGLAAGTTYSYTVSAYDTAGNLSAQSASASAATLLSSLSMVISPSADTFLNLDNVNNSTGTTLNTYTWPANEAANAILMKFDLSSLPTGAVIQSATLTLSLVQADATADATYTITVHKVINKNADPTRATGLTYDGTNAWTANSCCYGNIPLAQSDISAPYGSRAVDKVLGSKTWDLTAMTQEWVNSPTTNNGLLMNSDTTKGADRYRTFASMENATATLRPSLSITYQVP